MSTPTSANQTHSNPQTPVCLEKRGRIPTMRLTIDSNNTTHYSSSEADPHDDEVEELLHQEHQVPYLPAAQASRQQLYQYIRKCHKRIRFLETFISESLANPNEKGGDHNPL